MHNGILINLNWLFSDLSKLIDISCTIPWHRPPEDTQKNFSLCRNIDAPLCKMFEDYKLKLLLWDIKALYKWKLHKMHKFLHNSYFKLKKMTDNFASFQHTKLMQKLFFKCNISCCSLHNYINCCAENVEQWLNISLVELKFWFIRCSQSDTKNTFTIILQWSNYP